MRAEYDIYVCPASSPSDIVGRVSIDVSSNPDDVHNFDRCIEAIKAADCDPYAQCGNGCGPRYQARFVGYAGGHVKVPFVAIEALVAILNTNQNVSMPRDSQALREVADILIQDGRIKRKDSYYYDIRKD